MKESAISSLASKLGQLLSKINAAVHDNDRCGKKSLYNHYRCRRKFEAIYTRLECIYGFSDFDKTFCFFPYKNRWSSDHLLHIT